ncbi:hypothetical protein [Mycobacterium sp. NPDC006124]|uniref:hypothetical protein n=1 Tax=Mycobacterium sp. NPDC006124 TaxID=3156729 RepID=UPI00339EE728
MRWCRDAEGVRWTVRRSWWPFGEGLWSSDDAGPLFWIAALYTVFVVIGWPVWLVAKLTNLSPWTIKIRRRGKVVRSEKVKGLAASRRRMVELVEELSVPRPPEGEPGEAGMSLTPDPYRSR